MRTAQGKDIADIHTRPHHPLVVGVVAELVAVAEILISREWAGPGLVKLFLATYSRLEMTKWRWVRGLGFGPKALVRVFFNTSLLNFTGNSPVKGGT